MGVVVVTVPALPVDEALLDTGGQDATSCSTHCCCSGVKTEFCGCSSSVG